MITSNIHGQFMWFRMRLLTGGDIHDKMTRLWWHGVAARGPDVRTATCMASEKNGSGRGTIDLPRGSTACWEGIL